jgi:uncharacterized protein YbbC (DUF1343 family)
MRHAISAFLALEDERLHDGRVGLLCHACSYDHKLGLYLFEVLSERGCLHRLFLPEHGLFAELQDQESVSGEVTFPFLSKPVDVVSLYGEDEASLAPDAGLLADLDVMVVDLQDVGARYYTYATTMAYLVDALASVDDAPALFVLDRENPSGRQVEGTPLPASYASFVGRPGMVHRHGLTIGEMARLCADEVGLSSELHVVPFGEDAGLLADIHASPNIPTPVTASIYSGQCLLEGTILSEGRGTTRPFEIFGAPFLDWIWKTDDLPQATGARLRRLCFMPAFHKFQGMVCHGLHIHLDGQPYHSLGHSLRLIRWLREGSQGDLAWRGGTYEFRSDRPAIELLAGDPVLLDYLEGRADEQTLREALKQGEQDWAARIAPYLPRGETVTFAAP